MTNSFRNIPLALIAVTFGLAPPAALAAASEIASATLTNAAGEPAGMAKFSQGPKGVLIEVTLSGLTPGVHGIHIHQTGACTPDFAAAGDHFAPSGGGHGFLAEGGPHEGDLPNIVVGVDGTAVAHFFTDRISLGDGEASLFDDDGSAVIVHAKADTYGAEAGAGGRDACGVVEKGP